MSVFSSLLWGLFVFPTLSPQCVATKPPPPWVSLLFRLRLASNDSSVLAETDLAFNIFVQLVLVKLSLSHEGEPGLWVE